jgi:D-amino-acid oxidase
MVTSAETDVIVIGAGVSGLTTAVCLAESGLTVRVLAKEPPHGTTSAAAGASWGPYLVDDPRVLDWSGVTRQNLESIARAEPASGVRLVDGVEAAPFHMDPPTWARAVDDFRVCEPGELPRGYVSGWRYTIPIVDMPRYLTYLERRLEAAGPRIEVVEAVRAFDDVAREARVVVNCAGLGARDLVPDADISPIRGQVVVVENPGIDWFFQDHAEGDDFTYILPHGDHVVLGGNAASGSDNPEYDPDKDRDIAKAIIRRCVDIEPRLEGARVLDHRVGLRPTRSQVRVEWADVGGCQVMHNYGHGGSGLTLSWGCAQDVAAQLGARPIGP